jgi:hypothetical protein
MASGDHYQLNDFQDLLGQQVLNVYFYQSTAGFGNQAEQLCAVFISTMLPVLVAAQSAQLTHTTTQALGQEHLDDFFSQAPGSGSVGTQSDDVQDPFGCYAFRYNRSTREHRNGAKRIGGVPLNVPVSGVINGSFIATFLDPIASAMESDLTDGVNTFKPVIRSRVGTPPVNAYFDLSSVQYVRYSTQNTRKFGRGA